MRLLDGRTAVVTGSGRGIGQVIARRFLEQGAKVVLSDIDAEMLESARRQLEPLGEVHAVTCDVSQAGPVEELMGQAVARCGSLDILVNNAGVVRDALLLRMNEADWDLVLRVNLKGAFLATQAAAKIMVKQRAGRIINLSSVVGLMGNFGQANYAASKAGLVGLTKSAAKELAARSITVNAIAPGYIETEMTAKLPEKAKQAFLEAIPLKRPGSAEDVANAALFLASDLAGYLTGQVIQVDGGLLM